MNSKIVAAVAIGLVMGLIASSSLNQSEAQGQGEQKKQEWEYKVVAFLVGHGANRNADKHEEQIEKLTVEGWEYVGLLAAGSHADFTVRRNNQPTMVPGGNVLFKRPKR
jgi:hypothetical protein